jgi:hypothetical protein
MARHISACAEVPMSIETAKWSRGAGMLPRCCEVSSGMWMTIKSRYTITAACHAVNLRRSRPDIKSIDATESMQNRGGLVSLW